MTDYVGLLATIGVGASLLLISLSRIAKKIDDMEQRFTSRFERMGCEIEEAIESWRLTLHDEVDRLRSNIFWGMKEAGDRLKGIKKEDL